VLAVLYSALHHLSALQCEALHGTAWHCKASLAKNCNLPGFLKIKLIKKLLDQLANQHAFFWIFILQASCDASKKHTKKR